MSISLETPMPHPAPFRLPWPAALAALLAFATIALTRGDPAALVVLGLALLATYVVPGRLETDTLAPWVARLVLYLTLYALVKAESGGDDMSTLFEPRTQELIGQILAAELVLQCWLRRPAGTPPGAVTILLSGLVFLLGCYTEDLGSVTLIRFGAPAFTLLTILSLRGFRPRPAVAGSRQARRMAAGLLAATLAVVVGIGGTLYYLFWTYRAEITSWGGKFLDDRHVPESASLSSVPVLGDTFGQRGSRARVLRIENLDGSPYLRALAFDTYSGGHWGPTAESRPLQAVRGHGLAAGAAGPRARVTCLADEGGLLFAPLNAAGVDTEDNHPVEWSPQAGGPLRAHESVPSPYTLILSRQEEAQGPLAVPPSPAQQARCLNVPSDIDPRVAALAVRIGGRLHDPQARAEAVQAYLISHNAYSLTTHPGAGDPISNFVLEGKAAHCEYFASAAVILLRCLHVPARYVTGFYAHEHALGEKDVTLVRGQDAHAWAECWIAGRGWITVDATPGNGRPDATAAPTPWLTKTGEWLLDQINALRARVQQMSLLQQILLIASILLVGFLSRLWRLVRGRRKKAPSGPVYSLSSAELAALAARFEAWLDRQDLSCPAGRPWQEHLALLQTREAVPLAFLSDAQAFVAGYNQARFGSEDARISLETLDALLRSLESQPPVPRRTPAGTAA